MSEYMQRLPGENVSHTTRGISNELTDKQKRNRQIMEILADMDVPMTDREIARELKARGYIGEAERNASAPRVTEMIEKGMLEPVGKKLDDVTQRLVRVVAIRDIERRA